MQDNTLTKRFVFIGLGRLGQELLSRLSRDYAITCISMDDDSEDILKELKYESAEIIKGDATSRMVLEKARIDEAEAVIITTTTEKVNLEAARIIKEYFNAKRVISIAITPEGVRTLEGMGVEVENIFISSALGIRNSIESKTKTPHAIGLGKNEILEVELHPNSRLANKPIGFLKPLNWRLGIIYRDGNIIVPRPDVVLRAKDKVVILGEPQVLKSASEMMMFNYQKFPLEYGQTLVVYLSGHEEQRYLDEISYVYSTFPFERASIIYSDLARKGKRKALYENFGLNNAKAISSSLSPLNALRECFAAESGNQGLVMLSDSLMQGRQLGLTGYGKLKFTKNILSVSRCPMLISRGTFPYQEMTVPVVEGSEVMEAMEASLEIGGDLSSDITSLFVKPSEYISSMEDAEKYQMLKKTVASMSTIYKTKVTAQELGGNPILSVLGALGKSGLLMTGMKSAAAVSMLGYIFNPDSIWQIAHRSRLSTLILPVAEDEL